MSKLSLCLCHVRQSEAKLVRLIGGMRAEQRDVDLRVIAPAPNLCSQCAGPLLLPQNRLKAAKQDKRSGRLELKSCDSAIPLGTEGFGSTKRGHASAKHWDRNLKRIPVTGR